MSEYIRQPKPRLRLIIDGKPGAQVHPEGLPGYIGEMSDRATRKWQTLRELVPDFPAISMSPVELTEKIKELYPNLDTKISKKEQGIIEIKLGKIA